jgi:hypothetical protein
MFGLAVIHMWCGWFSQVMMDLGHLPRVSLTQIVCALAMLDHKDVLADVFFPAIYMHIFYTM